MKFFDHIVTIHGFVVAPRVGAWIEIQVRLDLSVTIVVAPRVGAWIEIRHYKKDLDIPTVAPRVGAWIEIVWVYCNTTRTMSLLV